MNKFFCIKKTLWKDAVKQSREEVTDIKRIVMQQLTLTHEEIFQNCFQNHQHLWNRTIVSVRNEAQLSMFYYGLSFPSENVWDKGCRYEYWNIYLEEAIKRLK